MRIILIRMTTFPPPSFSSIPLSPHASPASDDPPRAVTSETLLAGARELVIKHAGREYHLRLTTLGKLIWTA